MSFIQRLFGRPPAGRPEVDAVPASAAAEGQAPQAETATVRRIVAQLEALPVERARFVAAAGYVLARVANADMNMSEVETRYMERAVADESGISEAEAVLVVESAKQQARLFGSTEDFLVTREFRAISSPEERLRLLRSCFLAAAADNSISSEESAALNQVASELEIEARDLAALRTEFADRSSAVRAMRALQGG